jgi:hypothetical protein
VQELEHAAHLRRHEIQPTSHSETALAVENLFEREPLPTATAIGFGDRQLGDVIWGR